MHFTVSSSELLHTLTMVGKVIASKSTISILENFLFVLKGNELEVTGADLETTLKTVLTIDDVLEEGEIAVPAKILTDQLKSFANIPVEFRTVDNDNTMFISWPSGEAQIPVFPAEDYPVLRIPEEGAVSNTITSEILLAGINATLYATAEEELRPVMNGIYMDMTPQGISMVASDSHKLVCFTRHDIKSPENASFILHKRPAGILRSLLQKNDEPVRMTYDSKNAFFETRDTLLICRLIEGNYPAYRSVIPKNNQNKLVIDRVTLLNAVKRVSVCTSQATMHIKFSISFNMLTISAQDVGFNVSSHETLNCTYDGEPMDIGFKSDFVSEILTALTYDTVCFELADAGRAALIVNAGAQDPDEDITSLIMPIRVQ